MIGITADTNIYVSALAFAGLPRKFLMKAEAGQFRLAISQAILDELQEVLRGKFLWPEAEISAALSQLRGCTDLVDPGCKINAVSADPDDNRVIECAVAAGSRFIVTGDSDLLDLGSYEGIRIIKVAAFLRMFETGI